MIIFCLNYFLSNNLVWKLVILFKCSSRTTLYLTEKLQTMRSGVVSAYKDILVLPISYDALLAEGKFDKNVLA